MRRIITPLDEKREVAILGYKEEAIRYAAEHFIQAAKESIAERGIFNVALSGGSTPKAIFQTLTSPPYSTLVDWKKVNLFWSDERAVPPQHPESNFRMAMEAGFDKLMPAANVFRMQGEGDIEKNAHEYEKILLKIVKDGALDYIMLGMGEDGHTASLFPKTHGLHCDEDRLVIGNFIPRLKDWRMTLTFSCINAAKQIVVYILGKSKAEMLRRIVQDPAQPDLYPLQAVGTPDNKLLIIADKEAASLLPQ